MPMDVTFAGVPVAVLTVSAHGDRVQNTFFSWAASPQMWDASREPAKRHSHNHHYQQTLFENWKKGGGSSLLFQCPQALEIDLETFRVALVGISLQGWAVFITFRDNVAIFLSSAFPFEWQRVFWRMWSAFQKKSCSVEGWFLLFESNILIVQLNV